MATTPPRNAGRQKSCFYINRERPTSALGAGLRAHIDRAMDRTGKVFRRSHEMLPATLACPAPRAHGPPRSKCGRGSSGSDRGLRRWRMASWHSRSDRHSQFVRGRDELLSGAQETRDLIISRRLALELAYPRKVFQFRRGHRPSRSRIVAVGRRCAPQIRPDHACAAIPPRSSRWD